MRERLSACEHNILVERLPRSGFGGGSSAGWAGTSENGGKLMEEPGPIDWTKALAAVKASGYEGWMAFETSHATPELCAEQARENLALVRKYLA